MLGETRNASELKAQLRTEVVIACWLGRPIAISVVVIGLPT
jgi:hypothetical protein